VNAQVQEILDNATDIQRRYVRARLLHSDTAKAARSLGLHKSTPHKWANLDELEEAAALMLSDTIEAAKEKLESLVPVALEALERAAKGKGAQSVAAAKEILARTLGPVPTWVEGAGGGPLAIEYVNDWRAQIESDGTYTLALSA